MNRADDGRVLTLRKRHSARSAPPSKKVHADEQRRPDVAAAGGLRVDTGEGGRIAVRTIANHGRVLPVVCRDVRVIARSAVAVQRVQRVWMFHPLSEALTAWAAALRRQELGFNTYKIYRCPMTKDSFPGAPRTGHWIQAGGSVRNPYFGAEMLDCGSEVK